MRKMLLLSAIIMLNILSISSAIDPVVITGTWDRGNEKEVSMYRIISGRIEELASYKLQKNKKFGFAFEPEEEGFYVIGSGSSMAAINKYIFYFKPGDKLEVAFNDSSYTLVGKNTPENEALTKWHDNMCLLELRSVYFYLKNGRINGLPSTYVDFFPYLEEMAGQAKTYASKTTNKKFDAEFEKFRYYDMLRYAWTFISTPRSAHPEKEDYTDFYRNVDYNKLFSTTEILKYPFGAAMISNGLYIKQKLAKQDNEVDVNAQDYLKMTAEERQKQTEAAQGKQINEVPNDTLKGEIVLKNVVLLKTYSQFEAYNDKYKKYILTEDQQQRMNEVLTKLAQEKKPTETIDFSGTDVDEKKVSLSDFKGKVVVVDVWATWCGPCKREIPSLKAMEKDYHGKDVIFLSISVDEVKDKQKWKDFVKKEELTGVQLFGGNGMKSDVSKFYNIKSIPRFMVFDKKGNIVTDDSPRPSDPELAKMVDGLLKK